MLVTNQNLVITKGGGAQTHYPIWKDEAGVEYISLNAVTFVKVSELQFQTTRRETVNRG